MKNKTIVKTIRFDEDTIATIERLKGDNFTDKLTSLINNKTVNARLKAENSRLTKEISKNKKLLAKEQKRLESVKNAINDIELAIKVLKGK